MHWNPVSKQQIAYILLALGVCLFWMCDMRDNTHVDTKVGVHTYKSCKTDTMQNSGFDVRGEEQSVLKGLLRAALHRQ